MRSLKLFTPSSADSNSFAMAPSSRREMPPYTSLPLAFGTLTQMDPSLLNGKMTRCTASFVSSELPRNPLVIYLKI